MAAPGFSKAMQNGSAVLVDFAGRPALTALAEGRVPVLLATTSERPADALLVRPDGWVAWAAGVGEDDASARAGLAQALARWC
jgi:hypothetical protein